MIDEPGLRNLLARYTHQRGDVRYRVSLGRVITKSDISEPDWRRKVSNFS